MRWTAFQLAVGTIKPNFQRRKNVSYMSYICQTRFEYNLIKNEFEFTHPPFAH